MSAFLRRFLVSSRVTVDLRKNYIWCHILHIVANDSNGCCPRGFAGIEGVEKSLVQAWDSFGANFLDFIGISAFCLSDMQFTWPKLSFSFNICFLALLKGEILGSPISLLMFCC